MDERESFSLIALMLQEVAQRIGQAWGSKDYGILGSMQTLFHVKKSLMCLRLFHQRPKVASSVVSLIPLETPGISPEEQGFYRKTKTAFGQRRKTLFNALKTLPKTDALQSALEAAGIDQRGGPRP